MLRQLHNKLQSEKLIPDSNVSLEYENAIESAIEKLSEAVDKIDSLTKIAAAFELHIDSEKNI